MGIEVYDFHFSWEPGLNNRMVPEGTIDILRYKSAPGPQSLIDWDSVFQVADASGATTEFFNLTTNPDLATSQTSPTDPTAAVSADNSTLIDSGIYKVLGLGNVNIATGNQQAANAMLSDQWMPGANQVVESDLWANVKENYLDPSAYDYAGAYTNQQATGAANWIPVDPLVLDLNGDGVKLTSFAEAPVLFDIDHDNGGSKEITGWVSAEDGIVVMDLNSNGKIDGIHETMSEYFNGTVGAGGEAGAKPFANGFAALKSLDSNSDNAFTSADAAWINIKVWQDANHDGITDPGELKTMAELGISSISLTPTSQSGLVNGGNEILATGTTFTFANGTAWVREEALHQTVARPTEGDGIIIGLAGEDMKNDFADNYQNERKRRAA